MLGGALYLLEELMMIVSICSLSWLRVMTEVSDGSMRKKIRMKSIEASEREEVRCAGKVPYIPIPIAK